jgi:glucose-6-phosphate isomerase
MPIELSTEHAAAFLPDARQKADLQQRAAAAYEAVQTGAGGLGAWNGWRNLGADMPKTQEYARLKARAAEIRRSADAVVVAGVGGSYLGARAVLEALGGPHYNELHTPKIYFAGYSLSGTEFAALEKVLAARDFHVIVVSKSGTTLESALALRQLTGLLRERFPQDANRRVTAVTDAARGALKRIADAAGWETFVIPDDVGGRYSVLTPVGLLPLAAAGVDIDAMCAGAAAATHGRTLDAALAYAGLRAHFYQTHGRCAELFATYEPSLVQLGEWYKQLFGESEGKDGKGLFPAGATFTTDLHSLGQYLQDGSRLLFETVLWIKNAAADVLVREAPYDDKLGSLAGRSLHELCAAARAATAAAHAEKGQTPGLGICIEKLDAFCLGELLYFFELSCAVGAVMIGVDPFSQPGVERYKDIMYEKMGLVR